MRGGEADRAGVGLALGALERRDHLQGLDLGRPGHRAGREGGADDGGVGGAGRDAGGHVGHEVPEAGVGFGAAGPRVDGAVGRDAAEVVAREVHDHHVLGRVLGRALERLGRLAGRGALDRGRRHGVAGAAQEQLGGEAQDRAVRAAEERAVGRAQRVGGGEVRIGRAARELAFEPQAQVRLEQLPGRDPLDAVGDRGEVAAGVGGGQVAELERPRLAAESRADRLQPRRRVLLERLEPPVARGVLAQHVVVEAELGERERDGARRRGREPLDRRAQPVAQEAEPAAIDAVTGAATAVVEHVERGRPAHHAPRLRAHDRPRSRPAPGQRERALVVADRAQDVGDGRRDAQRDLDRGHPPSVTSRAARRRCRTPRAPARPSRA